MRIVVQIAAIRQSADMMETGKITGAKIQNQLNSINFNTFSSIKIKIKYIRVFIRSDSSYPFNLIQKLDKSRCFPDFFRSFGSII